METLEGIGYGRTQSQELYSPSLALAGAAGKDAYFNLFLQQPPPPPASTCLQQLLLSHLQQQQQQQHEASQLAALATYLLSQGQPLPCSMAPALNTTWQQPPLYRDAATATAWQSQPASSGLLYNDPQLAGPDGMAAAAAAVPFSSPSDWQLQQLQWQLASSQATLSTTQHLSSIGSTSLASFSSSLQPTACGVPMPLAVSSDFGCSYSSNGQAGPAAAALQLQAAAPALLDLSLSSLSLSDRNLNGSLASSLASSSPSRTSSLLHGSFGSLVSNSSSGGGSPSTSSWSSEAAAAAAAAVVECGSIAELSAQQLLDVDEEGPLVHNHFCRQEMSVALNATVTVLLNTLRSRQYAAENPQPKHRMYVCGLRESCKAIKCGKALAVLLAPDIQLGTFGKPDRVLDGRMREIILSSQVPQHGRGCVPVVFALSRKKIGQVFGSKKRMSAITLLDVSGVEELYGAVLQLAEEGRQRWEEMQSWH